MISLFFRFKKWSSTRIAHLLCLHPTIFFPCEKKLAKASPGYAKNSEGNKRYSFLLWILTFFHTTVGQLSSLKQSSSSPPSYVSLMMSVHSNDHSQGTSSSQIINSESESGSTALAVVLYQEEKILPHEKKERTFHIGGYDFHINQDWHAGGVAAVVWDAAVVLGEYLASNMNLVKGKQVLELGAGTGLAGMVAASLGANVVVTEREEALSYLENAISKNQDGKDWKIKTAVLDWTQNLDSSAWDSFDLVIGADIIYIEDTFSHLLKTLKSVSASSKTLVLLSCRIRYSRDLKFLNMLRKSYTVEEIFYDSKLDIKIFSAISKS